MDPVDSEGAAKVESGARLVKLVGPERVGHCLGEVVVFKGLWQGREGLWFSEWSQGERSSHVGLVLMSTCHRPESPGTRAAVEELSRSG